MADSVRKQAIGDELRALRRTPRGTMSREKVVLAGVQAVLSRGDDAMSIRGLARDLGVTPMTIYRHVHSREELIDAVAEELVAREWRPTFDHADWRDWILQAAVNFRDLLVNHPTVLQVYLRHPVYSPGALERLGEILEHLRDAGFSDELAATTCATVYTYTVGFAALEVSRARWDSEHQEISSEASASRAVFSRSSDFFRGINFLLEGIARELVAN